MLDPRGVKIKFDTLFINLYDHWTLYLHPHQQILRAIVDFDCSNMSTLEHNIRRKWKKVLPNVNIVLEKYKDADNFFNPMQFFWKI